MTTDTDWQPAFVSGTDNRWFAHGPDGWQVEFRAAGGLFSGEALYLSCRVSGPLRLFGSDARAELWFKAGTIAEVHEIATRFRLSALGLPQPTDPSTPTPVDLRLVSAPHPMRLVFVRHAASGTLRAVASDGEHYYVRRTRSGYAWDTLDTRSAPFTTEEEAMLDADRHDRERRGVREYEVRL